MAHVPTTQEWRNLADRIQNEKDPVKMIELVQELIASLEAEQSRNGLRLTVQPE